MQIKKFITETPIDFSVNFPKKTELKVPAIVLSLSREEESQTFLSDVMGTAYDGSGLTPEDALTYATLGGNAASVSTSVGLPRKEAGSLSVLSATESSLTFAPGALTHLLEAPQLGCRRLHVISGTGQGKTYLIKRISSYSLDIVGGFDPQLDTTSVVDIRKVDDPILALGEPSRTYDAAASNLQRIGSNYSTQYQLSVLAGHQDEVIYLYSVLKAILLSQRASLEAQGLIALKISGTDFAPRTEYLPSEVFQRVMTLQFVYPFSFLVELEGLAKQIQLCLTPRDSGTLASAQDLCFNFTLD